MLYSIHTTQKHRFAAILHAHVEPSSTKHHAPERPTLYTFLAPAYPTHPHSAYPIHAQPAGRRKEKDPPDRLTLYLPQKKTYQTPQPPYPIHIPTPQKTQVQVHPPNQLTL